MSVHREKTLSLAQVRTRVGPRVGNGLVAAATVLYDESQKLVPRDTEALGDSAKIRRQNQDVVTVGYGTLGFSRTEYSPHENRVVLRIPYNYAMVVHEDMEAEHPNGQADYLREPAFTKKAEMALALRAAVKGP